MTTNTTFTVSFIERTDKKHQNYFNIFCRITINGKRSEFTVVKSVNKDAWNPQKERLDSKYKDFKQANTYIDQVRSKLVNIHREITLKEELVTPNVLKNYFFGNVDKGKTLLGLIKYHNTSQTEKLSYGTLKNYFTTQKYIIRFLKEKKKVDDIYLRQLNYQFITEFESYLRSYRPVDHQRPLSNNGIMKHLERLRKMTTMAQSKKKFTPPPLNHIKIYFQQKGHPETEAERFFNYYESNGWMVGGRSKMKDWKAAARNWMLNIQKFQTSSTKPSKGNNNAQNKPTNQEKPFQGTNYHEPL
ncbi:hypothetical protein E9993_01895 [Labilibacter sediminis]|nr:hypothetical protein E9993_01895 [Labilibacter sediminis]